MASGCSFRTDRLIGTFTRNRAKQSIRIPGIVSDTQLTTSLHLGLSGSIKYQNETNENKLYLQSLP